MRLLGKEVKVGTRVRCHQSFGTVIYCHEDNYNIPYPFTIKDDRTGEEFTVTIDGRHIAGGAGVYDVVEVLDNEPTTEEYSDTHTTELELKNYRLTLENELLAQEVQELRQAVKELAGKLADLLLKGTPYE
jgi:hypothetical protein